MASKEGHHAFVHSARRPVSLRPWVLVVGLALWLTELPAAARPRALRFTMVTAEPELDGVPAEWNAEFRALSFPVRGRASSTRDLAARAAVAYDAHYLYVAAEVTDDRLVAGGDFIELLIGVPGGTLEHVRLYPGDTAQVRGVAKNGAGRVVEGARVVEAPTSDGWSLEARIPWMAIPKSERIRVGYRGALLVHDADASTTEEAVLATSDSLVYSALPALSMEAELSLGAGLLRERAITGRPSWNLLGDVVGDAQRERVLVYDPYLVVLGPGYRAGTQYFYKDFGPGELVLVALRDETGDGKDDIVVQRHVPGGDLVEVWSYAPGAEVPSLASSKSLTAKEPPASVSTEFRPLPGATGERATKTKVPVVSSAPDVKDTTTASLIFAPKPPPQGDAASGYALYKERRGVLGAPRFDLSANFAEDSRVERLVVHGNDIVVFGPGFRGGRSFAALTLDGDASVIQSVTARDIDGGGTMAIDVKTRTAGGLGLSTYRIRAGQFELVPAIP